MMLMTHICDDGYRFTLLLMKMLTFFVVVDDMKENMKWQSFKVLLHISQ